MEQKKKCRKIMYKNVAMYGSDMYNLVSCLSAAGSWVSHWVALLW